MTYVNLTDYNDGSEIRQAKLVYNGDMTGFSELHCTKFRLQSQSYPLFVPKIIKKEDNDDLHINNARNMKKTNILQTTPYEKMEYYTDWNICCYDSRFGEEFDGRYVNHNVKWAAQKNHKKKPFTYPNGKRDVLNNSYFHAYNSLHVISLIARCLREIGENMGFPRLFYMIKVPNGYQILRQVSKDPNNAITPKLFFNKALRQAFYFHYDDKFLYERNGTDSDYSEVHFDVNNKQTFELDGEKNEYIISQTLGFSSRLFPFSDIQFLSNSLKINPIRESMVKMSNELPSNVPSILSYSLNVTDIDEIVDNLNYNITSILHPNVIQSTEINSFDITCVFKTFDGYTYQITLDKDDSLNMYLEFI